MDPVTAFAALSAGKSVVSGIAGSRESESNAQNAELQAFVAGTQTMQRDTAARDDLNLTLGSIAASRAANGLSGTSSNAAMILNKARSNSNRNRLIERTDGKIREANGYAQASASRAAGRMSLISGAVGAGMSLYDGYNASN